MLTDSRLATNPATGGKIVVLKAGPDGKDLQDFGFVGIDEELVAHGQK